MRSALLADSTTVVVPDQLPWPIPPRERPLGMTPTLVPPPAPVPATRVDRISATPYGAHTTHYGAQRSPLTEVRHARRSRRLAVGAITTGLVSVTVVMVAIVLAGTW